jgi:hypothetical protein
MFGQIKSYPPLLGVATRYGESRRGIVTETKSRQHFSSPWAQLSTEIFPEITEPLYFQSEGVKEMGPVILARQMLYRGHAASHNK